MEAVEKKPATPEKAPVQAEKPYGDLTESDAPARRRFELEEAREARYIERIKKEAEAGQLEVIPLAPLPGNYSFREKTGDSEVTVTFQTLKELQAFLDQRKGKERRK